MVSLEGLVLKHKKTGFSLTNYSTGLNLLMNYNKKMKMAGFTMLINEDAVVPVSLGYTT